MRALKTPPPVAVAVGGGGDCDVRSGANAQINSLNLQEMIQTGRKMTPGTLL